MSQFRPMLAVEAELDKIRFPMLASYKLDGIRCVITPEGPRTRALKEVPNRHVARMLQALPAGLDGELVILDERGDVDFRATTSGIMSQKGEPAFRFLVFDDFLFEEGKAPFWERHLSLLPKEFPDWVQVVQHHQMDHADDVNKMFERALAENYEGLILRCPAAPYKHNRSTLKEQGMLKVKPWADAECVIYDWEPKFRNDNVAETNELGRTKRSSKKEGLVQLDEMGILVGRNERWERIEIGTGFTGTDRVEMFKNPPIGQTVRFRYISVGNYDKPRHASFAGFRHLDDMS